jgi:hypothetical protein
MYDYVNEIEEPPIFDGAGGWGGLADLLRDKRKIAELTALSNALARAGTPAATPLHLGSTFSSALSAYNNGTDNFDQRAQGEEMATPASSRLQGLNLFKDNLPSNWGTPQNNNSQRNQIRSPEADANDIDGIVGTMGAGAFDKEDWGPRDSRTGVPSDKAAQETAAQLNILANAHEDAGNADAAAVLRARAQKYASVTNDNQPTIVEDNLGYDGSYSDRPRSVLTMSAPTQGSAILNPSAQGTIGYTKALATKKSSAPSAKPATAKSGVANPITDFNGSTTTIIPQRPPLRRVTDAEMAAARKVHQPMGPYNVTDDMSTWELTTAGFTKAYADKVRGVAQRLGEMSDLSLLSMAMKPEQLPIAAATKYFQPHLRENYNQKTADEYKARDKALMNTTAGNAGNILGDIAITLSTMAIPGALSYKGAALIGGLLGAIKPTGKDDSIRSNTLEGIGSGVVKEAGLKTAGRFIDFDKWKSTLEKIMAKK